MCRPGSHFGDLPRAVLDDLELFPRLRRVSGFPQVGLVALKGRPDGP